MKNVALITGAYGGLGKCFVEIHGKKGGNMILVDRSAAKLETQAKEAKDKYHVNVNTIVVDLSKIEAAQTIYDECQKMGILPDIIIDA